MRLTTKFSAFVTLLISVTIFVMLIGVSLSFYNGIRLKVESRVQAVAVVLDNRLALSSFARLEPLLDEIMVSVEAVQVNFLLNGKSLYSYERDDSYRQPGSKGRYWDITVPSLKYPGMSIHLVYLDPMENYFHSRYVTLPLTLAIGIIVLITFFTMRRIRRLLAGEILLEGRARRVLRGERGAAVRGSVYEWPASVSSALDMLLAELQFASDQRSRVDTLIRAYAAQDSQTGLHNRLFFDSQLATLLDDQEKVGAHGIVMMIRLPEPELLRASWGKQLAQEHYSMLINLLSTFIMRYSGALLARYYHSDFAVLLPHRTLKEADSIASQLLKAVAALAPTRILDRDDMMHIGICAFRSGQSVVQVMEHAQAATRNAVLQGSNSWAVYDDSLPEKGRGNVRWRTLIEQMLNRGGPRFYQKPAVTLDGRVHHRELMCRIYDGKEEVIAAEYMPMVQQFGLAEEYDRLQITRLLPLLSFWPEQHLALQVTVESLIHPRFQRWLRDTMMQCEKSQRRRIIFELAEADVCQYIGRLRPIMRLINALGIRVAVFQAGLTLVGTNWIKLLNVEVIKLDPGLSHNIEKRSENRLLVQSLVEACKGMPVQVFATGVRSRGEWQALTQCGVTGGQGEFFAASQPLDTNVKKYLQRYSV